MSKKYVEEQLKDADVVAFWGECHGCKKTITVECFHDGDELIVTGGAYYRVDDTNYVKCEECFEKEPNLTHYRKCEVYSRVCGYLRPVNQWNIGKKAEYQDRKPYQVNEEIIYGSDTETGRKTFRFKQ